MKLSSLFAVLVVASLAIGLTGCPPPDMRSPAHASR
jgi:hypothetical protein